MYGLNDIKNPLRVPCFSCPSLCLCSSPLLFPILCLILALQPRLSFTIFLSQPSSLSFFISPFSSLPALLTLFFLFPQYITLCPPLSMTAYFSLVFCISIRPSHFIPLHPSPLLVFFYLNLSVLLCFLSFFLVLGSSQSYRSIFLTIFLWWDFKNSIALSLTWQTQ